MAMGKKPDVGSLERERAIALMNLDYMIDMSQFSGISNSAGFVRDSRKFWAAMLREYPQLFSQQNRQLIERNRVAPVVDEAWLRFHGHQRKYMGDKLEHHHVEQGPWAVGLPRRAHKEFHPEAHP